MRTALGAAALATTAVLTAALPAQAARLVVNDTTSDVASIDFETEVVTPVGTRVNVDLKRTVIRHDRRVIAVKASYVDLVKDDDVIIFGIVILTNEGVKRTVAMYAADGVRKGKLELTPPKGEALTCKGMQHFIDYETNVVSVSVPRACLSDPRWVKLHVYALTDADPVFADDGVSPTFAWKWAWTRKVKVG